MERLQKDFDDFKQNNSRTHEKIFDKLGHIEKNNAAQDEKYNQIIKDIEKLDKKLEELINKPSKRWESVIASAISAVVGGLIAFTLIKLGLKG